MLADSVRLVYSEVRMFLVRAPDYKSSDTCSGNTKILRYVAVRIRQVYLYDIICILHVLLELIITFTTLVSIATNLISISIYILR